MLSPERIPLYFASPAAFRDDLIVEIDGQPFRFGDRMAEFQKSDFAACDSGWLRCVGAPIEGTPRMRAYFERPRGHSKTTDIAAMVIWALVFARQLTGGYAAAADRDQGRLLIEQIQTCLRRNELLATILDLQANKAVNVAQKLPGYGSSLQVLASDVGSSYGILPSFVVCDELTHWQGDGDLFHSLISSAAKKDNAFLAIITNSGRNRGACWQWSVRSHAATSPSWIFSSLSGPDPRFLSDEQQEELRRMLPGAVYGRLVENIWSAGGDALSGDDIAACITQAGPMCGDEPGYVFVGGLDLSTKRDFSGYCVVGVHRQSQRLRLARCQSWAPAGKSGSVDLDAVKMAVIESHKQYRLKKCAFDPFQAHLLQIQAHKEAGVPFEEMTFNGQNLTRMASSVLEVFKSRQIDLYKDPRLISDLQRLNIVEKSFGWKLEADRSAAAGGGHADRAMALAIALPAALELLRRPLEFAVGIATSDRTADDDGSTRMLSSPKQLKLSDRAPGRRLGGQWWD
jgi:phage terminase large subunit-like protein